MPIRPELRHFYRGPEWQATRARIRERAGDRCERCGVPNHKEVLRQFGWWTAPTLEASVWANGGAFIDRRKVWFRNGAKIENAGNRQFIHLPWCAAGEKGPFSNLSCFPNTGQHRWVYIVCTVAHLNHVAGDDRDENLAFLCQWCHFKHDVRFHHSNARRTRARRVGQDWLSPEMERVL